MPSGIEDAWLGVRRQTNLLRVRGFEMIGDLQVLVVLRITRGCNGPRPHFVPIPADEPQGRYTGVDGRRLRV